MATRKSDPRGTGGVAPSLLAKLRAICMQLPEAYEETAWVGVRWMVRKKNFAHVLRVEDGHPPAYARAAGDDGPVTLLTFRIDGLSSGAFRDARFFLAVWGTRWGTKVAGMKLDRRTDWKAVASLLVESYRLLAPKKLAEAL